MNIGLIGSENSHAAAFGKTFNLDARYPGWKITHLWGETAESARDRAAEVAIPTTVTDVREMVGQVDAVIIDTRDGANHLALATPFLGAGIPLFIDKPLATDVAATEAFLDAAAKAGTPVTSHSLIPLQQSYRAFMESARALSPLRYLGLSMPAAIDSPYSGMFFYTVHAVECLCELLNVLPTRVRVERFSDTALATMDYPGGPLATINLQEGNYAYSLMAAGDKDTHTQHLTLDADPYAAGIDAIYGFFTGKEAPYSRERLLMPVRILAALERSKRSGAWVVL